MHVFILLTVIGAFPFILAIGPCPGVWKPFNHNCYLLMNMAYTWFRARKFCEEINTHLAIISNQEEQQFFEGFQSTDKQYWIGLSGLRKENRWQWVDGKFTDYTNWNSGEPNYDDKTENCVHINLYQSILGKWNDVSCNTLLPFICQKHI